MTFSELLHLLVPGTGSWTEELTAEAHKLINDFEAEINRVFPEKTTVGPVVTTPNDGTTPTVGDTSVGTAADPTLGHVDPPDTTATQPVPPTQTQTGSSSSPAPEVAPESPLAGSGTMPDGSPVDSSPELH